MRVHHNNYSFVLPFRDPICTLTYTKCEYLKYNGAMPDSRRVGEYWSAKIWIIIGKRRYPLHNNNPRAKLISTIFDNFNFTIRNIAWDILSKIQSFERACWELVRRRKNKIMKELNSFSISSLVPSGEREWSCLFYRVLPSTRPGTMARKI